MSENGETFSSQCPDAKGNVLNVLSHQQSNLFSLLQANRTKILTVHLLSYYQVIFVIFVYIEA